MTALENNRSENIREDYILKPSFRAGTKSSPVPCGIYVTLGGERSISTHLSTQLFSPSFLGVSDNARSVTGRRFDRSSSYLLTGFISLSVGKAHVRRAILQSIGSRQLWSSAAHAAIAIPLAVKTYTGRRGCPCPLFFSQITWLYKMLQSS